MVADQPWKKCSLDRISTGINLGIVAITTMIVVQAGLCKSEALSSK
jgi:hypothetical protein